MEFNYQSIVKELVIALRKNRTSTEVSRLMGFSFNQVRRWEAGEKQLRWDEFCDYCKALDVPLLKALQNNYSLPPSDPKEFSAYLRSVVYPYLSVEEISKRLHRHPSAMRRYVEGEVYPDLELMLAFIHLDNLRLPRLIIDILPDSYRSELRTQLESYLTHIERTRRQPILTAVKHWLETKPYKDLPAHSDAFIAERVGCSTDEARQYLAELVKIGGAEKDKNGKYTPLLVFNQVGMSNERLIRDNQTYWFNKVAKYYAGDITTRLGPVGRIGSTRIASATPKQAERINQILARVDSEIVGILMEDQDEPMDDVRLILFGSYSLQDLTAKE